ncbi:MAG: coenzyme F420 hydrogenase [Thermoplasmata archaeon]|nr:MAG: coenzyme F420 hydrogenase [Thermoplasmata archaeon]
MVKALKINKDSEQAVIDLLKLLLEDNRIKGVLTLKKINKKGDVAYTLITRPDELDDAVPFYPLMPINAGKLLSRFTLKGKTREPIIAVVKPCELRGFIELVKRNQGNLENLFFISSTCGGVYPIKMAVDGVVKNNLSRYWDAVKKNENAADLRPACKGCEEFIPYTADMTVDLIGKNDLDKQCVILLNTKNGEQLVRNIKLGEFIEGELDKEKLDKLRVKREKEKKKIFDEINAKINGIDGLIDIFGRCIGCHGCMRVCPICYCKLCEFESPDSEYTPSNYELELKKRGGLRVPPGILYYQLGRLTHVSISCVGCGSCEDVCPVNIPLTSIFKKVGESVQELFNYIPGRNLEEDIPLITFEKEEFAEIEE